ncbi:hypothetical protein CLG96_02750 [Sphingomonas oleivorans]|uniref:Uncharacterized protein n=1 Tax=Sphingomonas oleivorans TaxID=1735121 RepID=A0A2T5G1Q0_9SPHN|nr:hypothetical protein [Sphingomonas oleivorans]PTQ13074.1 hypothetical protein CLG96_02750 [Sphingomonas oleivorans]
MDLLARLQPLQEAYLLSLVAMLVFVTGLSLRNGGVLRGKGALYLWAVLVLLPLFAGAGWFYAELIV